MPRHNHPPRRHTPPREKRQPATQLRIVYDPCKRCQSRDEPTSRNTDEGRSVTLCGACAALWDTWRDGGHGTFAEWLRFGR